MNRKRKRVPAAGDVVLLEFPGAREVKRRPAVVVSSSLYHRLRPDIVVGLITSQIKGATSPTDYVLEDWRSVGLHQPSAYRTFLVTLPSSAVSHYIGKLSTIDLEQVRKCLQLALSHVDSP